MGNFVGNYTYQEPVPAAHFIRVLLLFSYRGFIAIASKDMPYWRAPDRNVSHQATLYTRAAVHLR